MITRIVKMTFKEGSTADFLRLFEANRMKIAVAEGCTHLELWNDVSDPTVFFTYSKWQNEHFLQQYRESILFNTVWSETKKLFTAKAEAWTVKTVVSTQ